MTYESSIGLEYISVNNTSTIPSTTSPQKKKSQNILKTVPFVFFDLETTGLSDDCEIVQVLLILLV